MITTIIFSRNRPLQLDLCLQSLDRFNVEKNKVIVIFTCDKEYKHAYNNLEQEHPDAQFWKQSVSLFNDVKLAVESNENDYVCFLTDDSFFYQATPLISESLLDKIFAKQDDGNFSSNRGVCSISLRLGLNINKRGVPDGFEGDQWIPDHINWAEGLHIKRIDGTDFIVHDRTQHFLNSYWNFPLTLDGSIFLNQDFVEWISELRFLEPLKNWKQTPNELECGLQRFINLLKPFVVFPMESCVVNSPNNRVQSTALHNKAGETHPMNPKDLLGIYNSGLRIDLQSIPEEEIFCPHQEINILKGLSK